MCGIDECAQATEGLSWIPLVLSKKALLAGDHKQLRPLLRSLNAIKAVEAEQFASLFERMHEYYPDCSQQLTMQHRANEKLINFINFEIYKGALESHASVENRVMKHYGVLSNPLVLV